MASERQKRQARKQRERRAAKKLEIERQQTQSALISDDPDCQLSAKRRCVDSSANTSLMVDTDPVTTSKTAVSSTSTERVRRFRAERRKRLKLLKLSKTRQNALLPVVNCLHILSII